MRAAPEAGSRRDYRRRTTLRRGAEELRPERGAATGGPTSLPRRGRDLPSAVWEHFFTKTTKQEGETMGDYERLADETMGRVCEALTRHELPFIREAADEIGEAVCDGIIAALHSGADSVRFTYQVAEQRGKVEIDGELPPGEANKHYFWSMLAGFTDQVEAEGYLRYKREGNPGKSYGLFVEGIPVDYAE